LTPALPAQTIRPMAERGRRTFVALCAVTAALASLIALPATSSSAAVRCKAPSSAPVTDPSSLYYDVTALSPCKAWAVGYDNSGGLIERWNGTSWVKQTITAPLGGTNPYISGISALASNDVWATGVAVFTTYGAFIEHWNGSAWTLIPTPTFLNGNFLEDVLAISKHDVWAVGNVFNGSAFVSVIEHWNGTKWKLVNHPQPGTSSGFAAVSGTSAKDVWAVGRYYSGTSPNHTLIEHWNGKTWKRVASPNALGMSFSNGLQGVGARTPSDAWAVGYHNDINGQEQTLVEHWNGKTWKVVKSPNPGGGLHGNILLDVVGTGAKAAWAVGSYSDGVTNHGLVLHWNGKAWKIHGAHPPSGGTVGDVEGVYATALNDVWWAGSATVSATSSAYVTHCC